jgi:chromosome segregation ATPase
MAHRIFTPEERTEQKAKEAEALHANVASSIETGRSEVGVARRNLEQQKGEEAAAESAVAAKRAPARATLGGSEDLHKATATLERERSETRQAAAALQRAQSSVASNLSALLQICEQLNSRQSDMSREISILKNQLKNSRTAS